MVEERDFRNLRMKLKKPYETAHDLTFYVCFEKPNIEYFFNK